MRAAAAIHATDSRTMHHAVRSRIGDLSDHIRLSQPFGEVPVYRKTSCACGGACPACQTKSADLKISQPSDPAEIEADRIADRVMQMAGDETAPAAQISNPLNTIHRACDAGKDEEQNIQRKSLSSDSGIPALSPAHVRDAIGSGGHSLDRKTRGFFESRFGYDLGSVRIHSGDHSDTSAQALCAQAYTLNNHIVFNRGKYRPDTDHGKKLLAHELAHVVQQQTGAQRTMIQKVDDATFEANSGVDKGITNGTMAKDAAINGKTFTVSCGLNSYDFSFKFSKAYKGDYPYKAAAQDVRGIYVKIEGSIKDKEKCGRCTPMQLIQVTRDSAKNSAGALETVTPSSATREIRGGWSDAKAPSRGWYVDRIDSATNPYYTSGANGQEGSETSPAILWDAPGYWSTDTNKGGDFYTCAVCQDVSRQKWMAACVQWGSYTDSSGTISFNPATPVAYCRSVQIVRDASERWDKIAGNTATGITF